MREYLRKLGIDRDGFMVALAGSAKDGAAIGDAGDNLVERKDEGWVLTPRPDFSSAQMQP